jgi:pimeloyl-ACP methyl ester carboxylesterase
MNRRTLIKASLVALALVAFGGERLLKLRDAKPDAASNNGVALVETIGGGFTLGSLTFAPCELAQRNSAATTAAFCSPFRVPENWDKPNGRMIDLKLAIVRSEARSADRDLVVLLAGGPGQAATEVYPRAANGFARLLRHRNVLLLDQRGTGGSHALVCKDAPTDVDTGAVSDVDLDKMRAQTRACLDEVSKDADPAQYTTTNAIRDLEAVRAAIGSPTFDLVGVSYGTRVAQRYLATKPEAIRSVVLDSAVPNEAILGADFATNLDASLKAQFAECTKTAACAQAFGDPYKTLYALREALAKNPSDVAIRSPRTFANEKKPLSALGLDALVRMFAYSAETAALLPLAIARANDGDTAPLVAQAAFIDEELADLEGSGMQLSVICAEDADLLHASPDDAKLILGDTFVRGVKAQCEVWPRGARPADFHEPLKSDKPVLILSGEFDPVTPPRYAEAIVRNLPNGRVLVAKGQGHSVLGRGCFPRLVATFVDTLDAKNLDAGCVAEFGATPAFIDYNGAAP